MKKILGILALLIFVSVFTTMLNGEFVSAYNMGNITKWSALFGILSIGVAFVIITGGIDLSIGSVVGLVACLLPNLLTKYGFSIPAALATVAAVSLGIGTLHGVLITRLGLQPFVVTLCGLLFYRGFTRWWTGDQTQGLGNSYNGLRMLATGKPCTVATVIMVIGLLMALFSAIRLVRRWKMTDVPRGLDSILFLAGTILLVVASSRFWDGFETQPGPELFQIGPYQVRGLHVEVPEDGQNNPAHWMYHIGLWGLVPSSIAFVGLGVGTRWRSTLLPLGGLAIAGGLLGLAVHYGLAEFYGSIRSNEQFRIQGLTVSAGTMRWLLLLAVFAIVALFMGALAWLVATVLNVGGQRSQYLLFPFLGSGLFLLVGMTPLTETMVPMPLLVMLVLAVIAAIFLNHTIYGRYLLALGNNEEAARFSGINTKRMIVMAYIICGLTSGLGGVLFSLEINAVQPASYGNFYELYAIAAAVLGGCSLRGGEGTIFGVVVGAAVMRVLYNSINILGIPTQLEFAIIGAVILAGAIVDVVVKRVAARQRT